MKRTFFISFLLVCVALAYSQDVIVKRDGSETLADVLEIGIYEIRYKRFENPDGPVYVVNKSAVLMIEYENGEQEVFESSGVTGPDNNTAGRAKDIQISELVVNQTRSAGIAGYIIAGPVLTLATAAAISDDFLIGGILGGVATVGLGISAPIIAGKARRTREITHVEGNYSARLAGWITYGIAMGNAVVALALTAGEVEISNASVIVTGLLGAASSVLFGLDAHRTAEQSNQYLASVHLVPTFYVSRTHFGTQITSIGVQLCF